MKRSESIKAKSNTFEVFFLVASVVAVLIFLCIQIINETDFSEFIKDFVQVNITSTLSIAALVASMGAFRWDHFREALIAEGMNDKCERKSTIYNKAKRPLYRVIKLNSIFIVINIITLQAGTIKENTISLYYFSINIKWLNISLIGICLIIGLVLLYTSMKYMKVLIFK